MTAVNNNTNSFTKSARDTISRGLQVTKEFLAETPPEALVLLHTIGLINVWDMAESLGFRIMKMSIVGALQRLQSSLDISTPFILLFVLQSDRLGFQLSRRMKALYIAVSLLSTFLAFSRFLLFVYGISFILFLMTRSMSRLIRGLLLGAIVLMTFAGIVGTDNLSKAIHRRLYSKSNYYSDHIRTLQYNALMEEHAEAPYFGKGIGGYSKDLVRDQEVKHSYEVQWAAALMQFGVVGLVFLLIPIAIIAFRYLQYPMSRVNLSFLCLYFLWILSGFTNPFLLSLQSGIIYTLFLIAPERHFSSQKMTDRINYNTFLGG